MISGYSFLNNLISSLGSEWLLHLYIFGGWPTNTILQQSWRKVLFSMKRVEEEEKRKKYSWWKVLFPIKWVVGGRRRKKKMEKWRKSIVFNQTSGGWRKKKKENVKVEEKYYFLSNKRWVEAMAPTHLAQLPDRGTWSVAPHHRHRHDHHRRHPHHHRQRHLNI